MRTLFHYDAFRQESQLQKLAFLIFRNSQSRLIRLKSLNSIRFTFAVYEEVQHGTGSGGGREDALSL